MDRQELEALVNSVAAEFSKENNVLITGLAINELINPAVPHLSEVTESLKAAKISTRFLENSVRTILRNSLDIARESKENFIGFAAVQKSMQKECPYLFWC